MWRGFTALPDAFLHKNLTQAPTNYLHTLWRVAPQITSTLFGGGRNPKKQKKKKQNKKQENLGKTKNKKKYNMSILFGEGGELHKSP